MNYQKIVNKENRLSKTYRPKNLVKIEPKVKGSINPNRKILVEQETFENWNALVEDAKKQGFEFYISSGYRSYTYQEKVLKHYIEKEGVDAAIRRVAIPGTSEHQTGLAFDYFFVRDEENHYDMLEDDQEYQWIKNNAHKYGFIIRYPRGKENITGFNYEPWHLRYVGGIATYLYENNLTLDEFVLKQQKRLVLTK
ncbi:MAG: M15 family metallopeptidase [Bacilli bacterium]|nr:M15 family metallopeptidase [Bacilli bacterium]